MHTCEDLPDPELRPEVWMQSGDPTSFDRWLAHARVLLVDDEPANLKFMRHVLETEGYGALISLSGAGDALDRFPDLRPDLVITDLRMPGLDGFDFIARMQQLVPAGVYLPVLVVTGDTSPEARRRALSLGARDFLTKPMSPAEVRLRVRNLLETRFLHERLREHAVRLEQRVAERTSELEEARMEVLYRLARAAEFRDDQSGQHTMRVGWLAGRIAQVLGVEAGACELIERAAPLHDIGKLGIPDALLLKPGRLEPHERVMVQSHTTIGADILAGSRYPLLQLAEEIALTHHERWDGNGYPHGLAGDRIPLAGRIVAAADVFDALTHERPYKEAWTVRAALAEIEGGAGTAFDPAVVDALLRVAPEIGVLELTTDASAAAMRLPLRLPFAAPALPDPVLTAALRRAEEERDALAVQVNELRHQVARRETPVWFRRRVQAN